MIGQVEQYELKEAGVMQRLWSGLVPSSLRRETMASDAALSVGIHPYGNHMCVFALCRDFKLRIWSCQVLWKYCNKYFSKPVNSPPSICLIFTSVVFFFFCQNGLSNVSLILSLSRSHK